MSVYKVNHRPITLLNVDLKLISHVLAQRLKKVLPKIINVDQTGYVKIDQLIFRNAKNIYFNEKIPFL
jgi:hypothetical protein